MNRYALTFMAGIVIGFGIMLLIGKSTPANPTKTTFKITGPDGSGALEFGVEGEGTDYKSVLEQMFGDSFFKNGALGWLAENQNVFPIDSEQLPTSIGTKICEPFPEGPLSIKIKKKRECAEKPVAKGLRTLAKDKKPPFHYVGNLGTMGVPKNPQNKPAAGSANVCKPGDYYGKDLQVGNPQNNEVIEVRASGFYTCTDASEYPDIQLSPEDALKLFPIANLSQKESVIIVPLE